MGLIVNADDFGKDSATTSAILEAFEKGYIDRTTLMANMDGASEAAKRAKELGLMDKVGLHLNITEGYPLTEGIRSNPLICDSTGKFSAAFYNRTKYRLYMDELTISQIQEEFDAQIKRYHELGFTLNHIDSHHHVHTNYPVYKALKRLAKNYEFSSVRLSRNLYKGGNPANKVYKALYNSGVKKLGKSSTEYFGSYRDFEAYFGEKSDDAIKKFINGHSIEIMVHPMYTDGVLTDSGIPMESEEGIHS